MKALSEQDQKVLHVLSKYPQGATLSQVQEQAEIKKKEYALYYLKKLIKKGHVRWQAHLYFYITPSTPTKPITTTKLTQATDKQRPHDFQVNAYIFQTSWGRVKATLEALKIPYHIELKGNMIRFDYAGREVRATSQYLYTFVEMEELPINLPIEAVKLRAVEKGGAFFEGLLSKSGLRLKRDRLGMLLLDVHYWQNGYPGNQIAQEALKDKSRIIYAYDLETGEAKTWADSSLGDILKELETSSETTDAQLKVFLQATENKEIEPYLDEIRTRRDIKELKELAMQDRQDIHLLIEHGKIELQFEKSHNELVKEAKELIHELRQERRQRRL